MYCSIVAVADTGACILHDDTALASALAARMNSHPPRKGTCVGDAVLAAVMKYLVLPYLRWRSKEVSRSDGKTRLHRVPVTWWDRATWKLDALATPLY